MLLLKELAEQIAKKGPAERTTNNEVAHHEWRLPAENSPKNTKIVGGVVGGKVPEIKPVKRLSFIPAKVVKADDKAEYSDKVDTDNEIQEANVQDSPPPRHINQLFPKNYFL